MTSDRSRLQGRIAEAHKLDGSADALREFYADWAAEYDIDLAGLDYKALQQVVQILRDIPTWPGVHLDTRDPDLRIVDVGCGTGFVGQALCHSGYRRIEGLDLSADMIAEARKRGIYRRLHAGIDLNQPIACADLLRRFDCAISVGLFTPGHVAPQALEQMAGLVRPGGILILSARVEYCDDTGFAEVSDALERAQVVDRINVLRNAPYADDGNAHYWVYTIPSGVPTACSATPGEAAI